MGRVLAEIIPRLASVPTCRCARALDDAVV
jgi:hypothetical protein